MERIRWSNGGAGVPEALPEQQRQRRSDLANGGMGEAKGKDNPLAPAPLLIAQKSGRLYRS